MFWGSPLLRNSCSGLWHVLNCKDSELNETTVELDPEGDQLGAQSAWGGWAQGELIGIVVLLLLLVLFFL